MEAERAMIGGNWEAKHNPLHRELLQDAAIIGGDWEAKHNPLHRGLLQDAAIIESNLEAIHNIIIEEALYKHDAKETDFDTCRTDVAAAP